MDSGHELRRLSQYLPVLPADIADRIAAALAAEAVRRTQLRARSSRGRMAVPRQRNGAAEPVASYVPAQRTAVDPV
jgi:negative regulator of sigma E activity